MLDTDIYKLLSIVNSENSGAICFNVKDQDILDVLLSEYEGRPLKDVIIEDFKRELKLEFPEKFN